MIKGIEISLCLIVKNEEAVLQRCLESAKDFADEIIIVDTGSTDRTKEIAKQFTDKVFDFEWINDFSAARNFAFSKATKDYQMWLDADDVVPEESIKLIKELKLNLDPNVEIVTMSYVSSFDSNNKPVVSCNRERLLKRSKNYQWIDPVHECIPLIGNLVDTKIEIWHKKLKTEVSSTRNIDIYYGLVESGKTLSPRQLYYFARELKDHRRTLESISYYEKFLETGLGWSEDIINTCFDLSLAYKATGQTEKVLPILLKSFEIDTPRPVICCQLGYYFKEIKRFDLAFRWFDMATRLPKSTAQGFVLSEYLGYIPNIEACVCLCAIGDYKTANEYNEKAGSYKPNCSSVAHNRTFIKTKI